jgi:hypothetical protein
VALGEGLFFLNFGRGRGCTWARLVSLFAEGPRPGLSAETRRLAHM